jgi:hypothetical protein
VKSGITRSPITFLLSRSGVGGVAQLGEHLLCKQGVGGSNPLASTILRRSAKRSYAECPSKCREPVSQARETK